jgi:pimeloyl-ACP methyl ester carboxylesterase
MPFHSGVLLNAKARNNVQVVGRGSRPMIYGTLAGHAQDVLEIVAEAADGPAVLVGHSVSAMIGTVAAIASPARFESIVLIGPSTLLHQPGRQYRWAFTQQDIDSLPGPVDRRRRHDVHRPRTHA